MCLHALIDQITETICVGMLVISIKKVFYSLTSAFLPGHLHCYPGTMTSKQLSTATTLLEHCHACGNMRTYNSDIISAVTGTQCSFLTVGLGHTLELILLLDGIPAMTQEELSNSEF